MANPKKEEKNGYSSESHVPIILHLYPHSVSLFLLYGYIY